MIRLETDAPATLAPAWTPDRMQAANAAATWLGAIGADLVACLDAAHKAGVFVPAKAGEAASTLQALCRAWERNSHGEPAAAGDKTTLGV